MVSLFCQGALTYKLQKMILNNQPYNMKHKSILMVLTSVLLLPWAVTAQTANELANIQKVRTYWDQVWNKGNLQAVADFYHPNAKHGDNFTIEGFQKGVTSFRTAFPDFNVEINDIFATEDKVITEVTYKATHTGRKMFGQEPLGKATKTPGLDVFTFKDGKCVNHQHVADHLELVLQMGLKLAPTRDFKVLEQDVLKAGQDYLQVVKRLYSGKTYDELVKNGEIESMNKLYADEYLYTDPNGVVYSKSDELEFYKNNSIVLKSAEMRDQKVRVVDPNTAIETGVIQYVGTNGKKPLKFTKRYTTTWIWREGRWQIVADHASEDRPTRAKN